MSLKNVRYLRALVSSLWQPEGYLGTEVGELWVWDAIYEGGDLYL